MSSKASEKLPVTHEMSMGRNETKERQCMAKTNLTKKGKICGTENILSIKEVEKSAPCPPHPP